MKRPITLLALGTLLFSGLFQAKAQAHAYGVETVAIQQQASLALHSDPNFDAGPRETARELEMVPYYRGTVEGFRMQEFYTDDGNIVYNADGSVAAGAKYRDIPVPAELALASKDAMYGTKVPQETHYESLDGTPESGGEWWLSMWFMRQPVSGSDGKAAAPDYSNYIYGGIALLIAVVVWRVRHVRHLEMQENLESLAERTQGDYFQSTRGGVEQDKSYLRMASDEDTGPYNALIGLSPLKRITYQA